MTTTREGEQGSQGSSRYGASPVGWLGEESPTGSQHRAGTYESQPPPTEENSAKSPPDRGQVEGGHDGHEDRPPDAYAAGDETRPPDPRQVPEAPDQAHELDTGETGDRPDEMAHDSDGTTPEPVGAQPPRTHPCPPSMVCDTSGIDDLQCEATGIKAESDALAAVAEDQAKRRTAFETARAAYTTARDEASQPVKDLNRTVDDLLDDTRCLLNRDDVECIDQAFSQVLDCLESCSDEQGCCVAEGCGFEDRTWTVGQMDDLRIQVERVERCFDEVLVKEPAALKLRVTVAQGLVDELAKDLKADPREDANRLYARAKRASWALDGIWGRFANVNEFQNCLCSGLTCSLRGRQWLALLAGKKAYEECQEASRTRRCQWLRDNMVDETLATQLILCPPGTPCGDEPSASNKSST